MDKFEKATLFFFILVVIFTAGYLKGCQHEKPKKAIPNETIIKGKINIVENKKGKVGRRTPKSVVQSPTGNLPVYEPPEGTTTIVSEVKGKSVEQLVKIHQQEYGLTFEPGISTAFPAYPSIGIDAKLVFFERYGAGVGLLGGTGLTLNWSPYVFLSRRIDDFVPLFRNTELMLMYIPLNSIPAGVGIRINL